MVKQYDAIIGIDPDIQKSGCVKLNPKTKEITPSSKSLSELMDFFQEEKKRSEENGKRIVVVVEASWKTAHNHHLTGKQNSKVSSKIGYFIGKNHQIGINICEIAKHIGLEVVEKTPLRKCWKGTDGKITHEEIEYFTGIKGRTNQEVRDALLIAWDFARMPIKINAK